jgi:hypothetical protein
VICFRRVLSAAFSELAGGGLPNPANQAATMLFPVPGMPVISSKRLFEFLYQSKILGSSQALPLKCGITSAT